MHHLVEELESRLLLSSAPLVVEGFNDSFYSVGTELDGSEPSVPGFDGIWAGSGPASIESGSLSYAGLGEAGGNRVQLNGSITVSREFALSAVDPLENYLDTNGNVGDSLDGSYLYLSVLMQVDGSSPPTSTFSLYNGGTSSTDRVFRISYSSSKSTFQAIVGPSGTTVNLDPLNDDTNLFVIKFDFRSGNDVISIWQNPTAGANESLPDAQIATYDIAFDRVAFSRYLGVGSTQFDELRLGNEWSAVTDEAALDLVLRSPITADGFNDVEYVSGESVDGLWSYIAGYGGAWSSLGMTTSEAGSLTYTGLGNAGANHIQLNGTDVVSRLILDGNNTAFADYLDSNGDVSVSYSGSSLYFSFLMQVDGSTPPASTFSLYNDGVTGADRVFRVLYHSGNTNFTAIAGSDGTPVELGALNSGTNLFVVRIDFADGNDTISIWQNPVAGAQETTPDAQITDYDIAFDRLAFTRYSGSGSTQFDELRFGQNWSSVTDAAALDLLPDPQTIVAMQENPDSPTGDGLYPSGFFPFIDEFGQYRYMDWEDKIDSLEELVQSAADEATDLAANPGASDLDEYGGWLAGPQLEATGYFYTAKVDGKWWFVDPDGRLFFSNGITGVSDPDREGSTGAAVKTGVSGREDYFTYLPDENDPASEFLAVESSIVTSGYYQGDYPLTMNFYAANALAKYGENWESISQDIAHERLKSWGFNTIGGWSDEDVYLQSKTPYTIVLFPDNPSLINGNGAFPDYFDPAYLQNVKDRIYEETGKSLNDSYNIGYFIHNELTWTRTLVEETDAGLAALAASSTQYAKIAFRDQLIAKYGTITALNAQWQTSYTSWADFLSKRSVTPNMTGAEADLIAFDQLYAEQYFSTTQQAMREAAPNHLYLGARFTGGVRENAAAAAMLYCDVVSINRYSANAANYPNGLEGDVPLIASEYHYSANDTGLLSDGLRTATDQANRADKFTDYALDTLNDDRYIGMHWLQYWDYPTSGKLNSNNNNSNLGFVSITDTPYTEMVDAARSIGASLYETRTGDFAFVVDGTLYVVGTDAADVLGLSASGSTLNVTRNGVSHGFALADINDVVVSGGYGADAVTLSGMTGQTLTLQGAEAEDAITINSGSLALYVDGESGGPTVTVGTSADIDILTGSRIGALIVNGDINIISSDTTPGVLLVESLALGTGATLDLLNNGLIVDYSGASPMATIQSAINSAYNSGQWDGVGITTSLGNAIQSAVGYAQSVEVLGTAGGEFMGVSVDATAVLIRHTLYGDANLSGGVDGSDFNRWNLSRNNSGNWSDADFNYDGVVDQADLDLWTANRFTYAEDVQLPPVVEVVVSQSGEEPVSDQSASKSQEVVSGTSEASGAVVSFDPPIQQTQIIQQQSVNPRQQRGQQQQNQLALQVTQNSLSLAAVWGRLNSRQQVQRSCFTLPAMDVHLPTTSSQQNGWDAWINNSATDDETTDWFAHLL